MKNFYFCLALLGLLLSCSNDETIADNNSQTIPTLSSRTLYPNETNDTLPKNGENPYDLAGVLHFRLLSEYYDVAEKPSDLSGIQLLISTLANGDADYASIAPAIPVPISSVRMSQLLTGHYVFLSEVLSAPTMSALGKSKLDNFASDLMELYEEEATYPVLHDHIVLYESEVLKDSMLTKEDKRILLTTSSIARFSAYSARKRPKKNTDPDWDLLIANVAGAGEGASYDAGTAVVMALTTGIGANEGIFE